MIREDIRFITVRVMDWLDGAVDDDSPVVDPLAWDKDGVLELATGRGFYGDGFRYQFPWIDQKNMRTWICVCRGKSGAKAKEDAVFLERGADDRFDGTGLKVGDAIEWGFVEFGRRRTRSERLWGNVVDIRPDRLVICNETSLAVAVKLANSYLEHHDREVVRQRKELREAETWAAAHGPADDDLDAIGMLG